MSKQLPHEWRHERSKTQDPSGTGKVDDADRDDGHGPPGYLIIRLRGGTEIILHGFGVVAVVAVAAAIVALTYLTLAAQSPALRAL